MPTSDLYIDVVKGSLVASRPSSTPAPIPPLVRGTTQNLRVMLLNPTGVTVGSATSPIYDPLPVSGQTIQLVIGFLGGTGYLTDQFTWTASTDLDNPWFSASLPLNTPEITTALGSSAQITPLIQIDRVESGTPTNVLIQQVTLKNALIVDGAETSSPGRTLLYAETASVMFLTRRIVGPVEWVNDTDSTKVNRTFTDTDGTWQAQPVT